MQAPYNPIDNIIRILTQNPHARYRTQTTEELLAQYPMPEHVVDPYTTEMMFRDIIQGSRGDNRSPEEIKRFDFENEMDQSANITSTMQQLIKTLLGR